MDLLQEFMQGVLRFWRSKVRVLKSGGVKKETFWQKWKNSVSRKIESDKKRRKNRLFWSSAQKIGVPEIQGSSFWSQQDGSIGKVASVFGLGPFSGKVGFSNFRVLEKEAPGAPRSDPSSPVTVAILQITFFSVLFSIRVFCVKTKKHTENRRPRISGLLADHL